MRKTQFKTLYLTLKCLMLGYFLAAQDSVPPISIVIHGGAGYITQNSFSDSLKNEIENDLRTALSNGYRILEQGGTSVEAVEAAITYLEDSEHFNAGRGAVLTSEGKNELDASVMRGSDLNAGAVAGIRLVRNPIRAAIMVMNNSEHVMLSGDGALQFAREQGLQLEDEAYFITERSRKSLERAKAAENKDEGDAGANSDYKFGTVGAVALDKEGNIAAGTSTGGMTNKKHGRIGDSPIIGAGTYADNNTCGISCTGHGEFFIRLGVAKDVSDQMEYAGKSLEEASANVVFEKLKQMNAAGGLIGLDSAGNYVMMFNTSGMFRGFKNAEKEIVLMFADE